MHWPGPCAWTQGDAGLRLRCDGLDKLQAVALPRHAGMILASARKRVAGAGCDGSGAERQARIAGRFVALWESSAPDQAFRRLSQSAGFRCGVSGQMPTLVPRGTDRHADLVAVAQRWRSRIQAGG